MIDELHTIPIRVHYPHGLLTLLRVGSSQFSLLLDFLQSTVEVLHELHLRYRDDTSIIDGKVDRQVIALVVEQSRNEGIILQVDFDV